LVDFITTTSGFSFSVNTPASRSPPRHPFHRTGCQHWLRSGRRLCLGVRPLRAESWPGSGIILVGWWFAKAPAFCGRSFRSQQFRQLCDVHSDATCFIEG